MPTRAGRLLIVAALTAIVAGRLLALAELTTIGVAGLLLVASACVLTIRRPDLRTTRTIGSRRIHVGSTVRVELTIENTGRRRSPIVRIHETVPGTAGADLWIPPLRAGHPRRAGYRLPTERRGRLTIGPLVVRRTDPLGLAARARTAVPAEEILVLPRIAEIGSITELSDLPSGPEPRALGATPTGTAEFSDLRPYVTGDDLRRVHWPSTARTGELQVRRAVDPPDPVLTVFVDADRDRVDEPTFETIVSTAAGLVDSVARTGGRCRIVVSDGTDTGALPAASNRDGLLEILALLTLHDPDGSRVPPAAEPGAALVLTGGTSAPIDEIRGRWDPRHPVFAFGPSGPDRPDSGPPDLIPVPVGSTLADAWTAHRRSAP